MRAFTLAATCLLLFLGTGHAQDVRHDGKSLREWADIFRADEKGRERAAQAFRSVGERAVPVVVELLQPKEQGITRAVAATVLWQMRAAAKSAVPALEKTLASDADVVVRVRAAQALLGVAGTNHVAAARFLRDLTSRPDTPDWIRNDARAVLKDAGL
jgi:hypothetical protein